MPMRRALDIRCPRCGRRASFGEAFEFFAEPVEPDGRPVHRWGNWHVRERYPSIFPWEPPSGPHQSLRSPPLVWRHLDMPPNDGAFMLNDVGVVKCPECHLVARHRLEWPADAYFQWNIRGDLLWAEDAEHARVLLRYLGSARREPQAFGAWAKSLQLLPANALAARNRELVMRRIRASLRDAGLSDAAPDSRPPG